MLSFLDPGSVEHLWCRVIYQLRGLEVASPSPSDQASVASSVTSNSDSGIGGRDTEPSLLQVGHRGSSPVVI